jgi:hypothetical protein
MNQRVMLALLIVLLSPRAFPVQAALAQRPSFTGRYNTNWGQVVLTQSGQDVTGSYTGKFSGSISGTVKDRTLHFSWQGNGESGRGIFALSADGRTLTGTWGKNESATSGRNWSGVRESGGAGAQPAPPPGATGPTPAGLSAANNTFFVTWRDPRENAFRLGVPAGWHVAGGTFRAASIDVSHVVQVESPDKTIRIFLNDPDIRPRQVPAPMLSQMGVHEGQVVQGPWGGPVLVSRYLPGEQFAGQYAATRLCPRGQVTASAPLIAESRELTARLQAIGARISTAVQANLGEAYFRCGTALGYTFASTMLMAPPGGGGGMGLWVVPEVASVIVSGPAQARFGAYVLHTMMETFAMNPEWEARQAKVTQDVTGASTQMAQAMAQSIAQHGQRQAAAASAGGFNHPNDTRLPTDLRAKWAREDVTRQKFSDATMGQHWMHSPTGENVRVDNSVSNWWMDHNRNVVAGPPDGSPPPGSQGQYKQLQNGWQP